MERGEPEGHPRSAECKAEDEVANVIFRSLIVEIDGEGAGAVERHVSVALREGDILQLFGRTVSSHG